MDGIGRQAEYPIIAGPENHVLDAKPPGTVRTHPLTRSPFMMRR